MVRWKTIKSMWHPSMEPLELGRNCVVLLSKGYRRGQEYFVKRGPLRRSRVPVVAIALILACLPVGVAGQERRGVDRTLQLLESSRGATDSAQLTLEIVRSGEPAAIDTLVRQMGTSGYLSTFNEVGMVPGAGSSALATLVGQIVDENPVIAEHVLDRLANDEAFCGRMKGGDAGQYARAILIIKAAGRLQPQSDETYHVLQAALSRSNEYSELHALRSLVEIGTARAAEIIRRSLFQDPQWDKRTLTYISECAVGRDRPPIFELILTVSKDAPTSQLQVTALETLIAEARRPDDPEDLPVPFPPYQRLRPAQRLQLIRVLERDAGGFDGRSREGLDVLRKQLRSGKRSKRSPQRSLRAPGSP